MDRFQQEAAEIDRAQQFGADRATGIGGVRADPLIFPVTVIEPHEPEILQPVALLFGYGKDHRVGESAFGLAMDAHAAVCIVFSAIVEFGRRREGVLRPEIETAIGVRDTFAKRNGTDVTLPHGAQAHDEATRTARYARLVRMRDDRRIHQGRSGVGVFVTEKCADQSSPRGGQARRIEMQIFRYFLKPGFEQAFGLPVTCGKIALHPLVFAVRPLLFHREDIFDQFLRATTRGVLCLPAKVEGPQDDPARIGVQPLVKYLQRPAVPGFVLCRFHLACPSFHRPNRGGRQPASLAWIRAKDAGPGWIPHRNSHSRHAG